MRLLERYRDGQHVQVWTELLGIGPAIRVEPDDWAEAQSIARETMARVKRNLERLREALPSVGYRFTDPDRVIVPPSSGVAAEIARMEETIGPVPLAFGTFWETVGSVDFSGAHPHWPHRLLDPLMFEASADYYVDEYRDRMDQGHLQVGDPFDLDFSPDDLHKADISGGPPYAVRAPDPSVDGLVVWEVHQTSFVNYLRIVLRHAGLGGLSPVKRHGHAVHPVPREIAALAADLEAF